MKENSPLPPSTKAFSEYVRFEPVGEEGIRQRDEQNALFRTGKLTNPTFEYPRLRDEDLSVRNDAFTAAISATHDEVERAKLVARQKGVEIAQASLRLVDANTAHDHTARWEAGNDLVEKTERRYGEVDAAAFWPVMAARIEEATMFQPGNLHASMTKDRLLSLLPQTPEGVVRADTIDRELLDEIRPEVMEHLAPILDVLPEEGEYTSDEIKELGEKVLESLGLTSKGWSVVQNPATKVFSTARANKQLVIPNPPREGDTIFKKSAADLRRLFSHEAGIHALWQGPIDSDVEEGLAILMECVVSDATNGAAIQRAEERYVHVGLAAGIDGVQRNARQVFEITWRLEAMRSAQNGIITPEIEKAAKEAVQVHIDNIFRGTDHKLPGVYYNKAKSYLEGVKKVVPYVRMHSKEKGWLTRAIAGDIVKAA